MPEIKARTCLFGGILLLSSTLAVAVQPLEISQAFVLDVEAHEPFPDYESPHSHLIVLGTNFMNGGVIELSLGGFELKVISQEDFEIQAELPPMSPGSYQLVATTGGGTVRQDDFDGVTIGAVGLQGEQGLPGVDGAAGVDGTSCSASQGTGIATVTCTNGTTATVSDGGVGPQGATGAKGDPGPAGADGADGANGTNGINGAPGAQGDTGPQGEQGPQGQPGNLALAGLSCSSGQFVVGFDSLGNLVCGGTVDNDPQVSYIASFDGDLLILEFFGPIDAEVGGGYEGFDGGTATGRIAADLGCVTPEPTFSNMGDGYRYALFGPLQSCFGEWVVTINSPTGTTQTLSLDQFLIEVVWDADLGSLPGGWIRLGSNVDSISEIWTFDMFTAEPLPVGTHLPAAVFLNQSQNFYSTGFHVQNYGTSSGLWIDVGGPTLTYSFSQSSASSCTAGETQTAQCTTIVDTPFLVCQDATRTRACDTSGWGAWGSCSGEVISDSNGVCP